MTSPRAKGAEFEREVIHELQQLGLEANKAPIAGATQSHNGDIWILPNRESKLRKDFPLPKLEVEAIRRKRGFKTIYDVLDRDGGNDIVVARDDRKDPFFVLSQKTFHYFMEVSQWLKQKEE
jgi:hypothetical protein